MDMLGGLVLIRASNLPLASQAAPQVILVQTPPSPSNWIDGHQVIVVGILTFLIGILTVSNAFASLWINKKNRQEDKSSKRFAFLAVFLTDLNTIIENLRKTSEVIDSIDPDSTATTSWLNGLRVASRIGSTRPLGDDWEKLAILSINEIIHLRRLQDQLIEINSLFSSIIDDPRTARLHGAQQLFDFRPDAEEQESGVDRLRMLFDDLAEAVTNGRDMAIGIRDTIKLQIGVQSDGVETKKKPR